MGIDARKILVSKKEPFSEKSSFKYFTECEDNDDIRPLCIKLPQMIWGMLTKQCNKTMSFKVIDEKLLKK